MGSSAFGKILAARGAWLDGLRAAWRSPGRLPLLLGAAGLGFVVAKMPVPFREPGLFSLEAYAALDQFLVLLLVAALLFAPAFRAPERWWPVSPALVLPARGCGVACGLGVLLAPLVTLHFLTSWMGEDLLAVEPESRQILPIGPRYFVLWGSSVMYGLVLVGWGQVLRIILPPAPALLVLLVLVFSGFLVPGLLTAHPSLAPLLGILPDLGSLAPSQSVLAPSAWPEALPYALLHAAAVWCLGAALLTREVSRHCPVDALREAP